VKTRLSQIIAAAIGPNGQPDRAKIYHDLCVSPDAPEAFLIEAVLTGEETQARSKSESSKILADGLSKISGQADLLIAALDAHRQVVAEDAKSRRLWLSLAIAIPSFVTILGFSLIYFLLHHA
jgi:hypothetical protein